MLLSYFNMDPSCLLNDPSFDVILRLWSNSNLEGCSSTDQILNLFSRDYQFKSYKPFGH
jgi:hypothetical protein